MSSSPSVAAGSKVLSVVGTCPPHDGVRGVASQCIILHIGEVAVSHIAIDRVRA